MSRIILFGAGGNLGRRVVAEATGRGHALTAVVRDPDAHADLAGESVRLVAGDAGDAGRVAELAAGHDAVIATTRPPLVDPPLDSFAVSIGALVDGTRRAGVGRLLVTGMAATLETEDGVRLVDTPDYRADWLPFSRAHERGLDALLAVDDASIDWLAVSPPLVLDPEGPRSGRHRVELSVRLPEGGGRASYADFAAALVDEVERPAHHRGRVVVTEG